MCRTGRSNYLQARCLMVAVCISAARGRVEAAKLLATARIRVSPIPVGRRSTNFEYASLAGNR